MCLIVASASTLSRPSTYTTKGEKWRCFWRNDSRYFFFFSLYAVWRHFSGDLLRRENVSVFTARMSWILSVPLYQRLLMRRSPSCSKFSIVTGEFFGRGPHRMGLSLLYRATLVDKGVVVHIQVENVFTERSETPSRISLWQVVMRPPFLQYRAWNIENLAL